MKTNNNYCREVLKQEFTRRKDRNSMYSLRAFARDLEIGSTSLSDVLSCKRKLSKNNILKISKILSFSPEQESLILEELKGATKKTNDEIQRLQVAEDTFRLISDWYYLAILNLSKIKSNQGNKEWVARRLGITEIEAQTALELLIRMKFIEIKNNKIIRTSLPLSTTRDVPSLAIRKHHRENLRLAEISMDLENVHLREFSSITMPVDMKNLEKAKDFLMKVKRKVAKILDNENATEVYTLSFQLFPLTKNSTEGHLQ